ncbi:MAG: cell wall hydrolase [Oscillospiraceae bacterium]|nr:cell wall hydrolase [Oscillospiraceae bacterium]
MKKWSILFLCALVLLAGGLFAAKTAAESAVEAVLAAQPQETTAPTELPETHPAETEAPAEETTEATTEATTEPVTEATTQPTTEETEPFVLSFTEEEEELLLKIAMAERGNSSCTECAALVMRTVLNRVEAPKFSSTIKGVLYAQDQFTPVMDGSFEEAEPNDLCRNALDMVKRGWDESRGALYYEWCQGESWHSQNLNLLFQHCDVRFYN